jgi:hypothetical protein
VNFIVEVVNASYFFVETLRPKALIFIIALAVEI